MITQIVYLAITIVVLAICFIFVCIRGAQMEHRIENFESLFEHQRNIFKLDLEHTKNIYNNLSKCSEEIEQLKKDLSVLEGIQSKMDVELSKINVLDSRINSLEWHVSNLNALHPVRYEPTVTDKPDPLNPSGIMYDTNTTELKSEE